MSKYLVCINPDGTNLRYGEKYLCVKNDISSQYLVYSCDNKYYGILNRSRFVPPQLFNKEYCNKETHYDIVRSGSRKLEGLINELERLDKQREQVKRDIKENYEKIGKQLSLL